MINDPKRPKTSIQSSYGKTRNNQSPKNTWRAQKIYKYEYILYIWSDYRSVRLNKRAGTFSPLSKRTPPKRNKRPHSIYTKWEEREAPEERIKKKKNNNDEITELYIPTSQWSLRKIKSTKKQHSATDRQLFVHVIWLLDKRQNHSHDIHKWWIWMVE